MLSARLWPAGGDPARYTLSFLTWVAGAALVVQTARLALLALDAPYVPSAPPIPLPAGDEGATGRESLATWHLFGKSAPAAPLFETLDLPETPLALRLRGIVAAPDGTDGYALIADDRGGEAVYRIGQEVPGGAQVVAIRPDQVVLERGGRRETLRLERDSALAAGSRTGGNSAFTTSPGTGGAASGTAAGKTTAPLTITAALPNLMPGIRMDAAQLANQIQVMPVAGGGFRVFPGRDTRLFSELGLEANDIVEQVNGRTLTNPAEALGLFQQIQGGEALSLTVRRGERQLVLRPDMERLRALQPAN